MTFLFSHSTQKCLISSGQNRLALWDAEKDCWRLVVVCKLLWPFVVSKYNATFFLGTYGRTTKPLKLLSAYCVVNALPHFWIKAWHNCYLAKRLWLVAFPFVLYLLRGCFRSFQQSVNLGSLVSTKGYTKRNRDYGRCVSVFCKHPLELLCRVYLLRCLEKVGLGHWCFLVPKWTIYLV